MKKLFTALLILGCSLGMVACKADKKKTELAVPTELVVENQYISFNEVANASYYAIYYDGSTFTVKPSNTGEVVYDASKIFTEVKTYEVKVKAIGTGKYLDSTFSDSFFYVRTENLGVPSIKLNQETLTWSTINNATCYTIKVTFPDNTKGYYTYTNNTFDVRTILNNVGTYTFQVKAGTVNEDNQFSPETNYVYTKTLSTPSSVSLDYNKDQQELYLYFITDAEAVSYTINVNDVNYELTDSLFATYGANNGYSNYKKIKLLSFLKSQSSIFDTCKDFNVSVKANAPTHANYQNSGVSNKVSISLTNVLSAPVANLTNSGNQTKLNWGKINNATGYAVYLNYELFTNVDADVFSLVFNKEDLQDKIISVQAIGVDGKFSSPLSSPVYLSGMSEVVTSGSALSQTTLSFDDTLDKYLVEIYNEEVYKQIVVENDFSNLDLANFVHYGIYTVKVSGFKNGDLPKLQTFNLNYTKSLSNISSFVVGTNNSLYTISFRAVEGAIGYAVKINNQVVDKLFTSTLINLTSYISTAGTYKIQVQAVASPTQNISSSAWSSTRTVEHTKQIEAPDLRVEYDNGKYLLKFDRIESAYNYTILINYIPVFESDVSYSAEGYDITSYLTTAQKYTVMVKANAMPGSIYDIDSEYSSIPVSKYMQLDVINADGMIVSNEDGKYWLNFTKTQTHAVSYDVRIYNISSEKEQKINIVSVPVDITSYLQDSGTYKIYVTAIAGDDSEYLYLSSAESGNPLVITKDKPTLDMVKGFLVNNKVSGQQNLYATWNKVDNADKYYMVISYSNNYDTSLKTVVVKEGYTTANSINIAEYLSKEGQYTIKLKAVSEGEYESPTFATFTYNYSMTVDTDFMRNKIVFNGKTYSHYVTSYQELEALMQYYYLYDNVIYRDTRANQNYTLKFMLDKDLTIDQLNAQCESVNLGFTNDATDENNQPIADIDRIKKLTETAVNSYSERVYFSLESPFTAPTYYSDAETSYYLFNYKSGLASEKVKLEYSGNTLFTATYKTIASQLKRNENYIYKLELKDKLDVTTTEQLFMAVQAGYAPNFVGEYTTAKIVYDNCKNVLNTICTDEMTDYEKVVAIYNWIINNVNYNYAFDEFMSTSNSLGAYLDASMTTKVGDCVYNYLEGIFLDETSRIATSNGISKAFVLMCGLEGIEAIKVNGIKNNKHFYWNKVKIDCFTNDESDALAWHVVDISSAFTQISMQDGVDNSYVNYNVVGYQYFLITDTEHKNYVKAEEKYLPKTAVCNTSFNYYSSTTYNYEKKVIVSGGDRVTYSGSGILKYTAGSSVGSYIVDVMKYLTFSINTATEQKLLLELDMTDYLQDLGAVATDITNSYYNEVKELANISYKINTVVSNKKILIAISYIP